VKRPRSNMRNVNAMKRDGFGALSGSAKGFRYHLFRAWRRRVAFEFVVVMKRRSQHIHQMMERCKIIASGGGDDGLFDQMIAWNKHRIRRKHRLLALRCRGGFESRTLIPALQPIGKALRQ